MGAPERNGFGGLGPSGLHAAPDVRHPRPLATEGLGGMGRVGGLGARGTEAGEGYRRSAGVGMGSTGMAPASCPAEGTLVTQFDGPASSAERAAVERSVAQRECALVRCLRAVTDWPVGYATVRMVRSATADRAADRLLVGPDRAPAVLRSCVAHVLERAPLSVTSHAGPAALTLTIALRPPR